MYLLPLGSSAHVTHVTRVTWVTRVTKAQDRVQWDVYANGLRSLLEKESSFILGNGPILILGNGSKFILGNGPRSILGHGPRSILGHGPRSILRNGPRSILGNGPRFIFEMDWCTFSEMDRDPFWEMDRDIQGNKGTVRRSNFNAWAANVWPVPFSDGALGPTTELVSNFQNVASHRYRTKEPVRFIGMLKLKTAALFQRRRRVIVIIWSFNPRSDKKI